MLIYQMAFYITNLLHAKLFDGILVCKIILNVGK
jgi:hypothetical protein